MFPSFVLLSSLVAHSRASTDVRIIPLNPAEGDIESPIAELAASAISATNLEIIDADSVSTWMSEDESDELESLFRQTNESTAFMVPSHVRGLSNVEIHELDQDEIQACERKYASIGGILIILFILIIALILKFTIPS